MLETILPILLTIAVVGIVVYLICLIRMPQVFKNIIAAVAALLVIIWLLTKLDGGDILNISMLNFVQ